MVNNGLNLGIVKVKGSENPAQGDQPDSVQEVVRLSLNSASAIQRLVNEQEALRSRIDTLERKLTFFGINPARFSIATRDPRQNS
jgi:hypothetical protein